MFDSRKTPGRSFLSNHQLATELLEARQLLTTIQLVAAGDEGGEAMTLTLDGTNVDTWQVSDGAQSRQFRSYKFVTKEDISIDQVRVYFSNDAFDPANGINSNLRLDAILLDGQRYETEADNVFSTGTWQPDDGIQPGFRNNEYLHANGYFQFGNGPSAPAPPVVTPPVTSPPVVVPPSPPVEPPVTETTGSVVEVRARGDEGGERFRVLVGGQASEIFTTTTSLRTFRVETDSPTAANEVRVQFLNDRYEPAAGIDFNLVVDYIQVDGSTYQTEAQSTLSTGTWRVEDGITTGFRQSETLHANGYFQYLADQADGPPRFDVPDESDAPTPPASNGGDIRWGTGQITFNEADGRIEIPVERVNGSSGPASAFFQTLETERANLGSDFVVQLSGRVDFADGQTQAVASLQLIDDDLVEPTESFSVSLFRTIGADLGFVRTVIVSIVDDESESAPPTDADSPSPPVNSPATRYTPAEIAEGFNQPTEIEWLPDGRMLVAELVGRIRVVDANGNVQQTPFLDISRQVNNSNSNRGLIGMAVHPDFSERPFLYVAYSYDPPEVQGRFGDGGADGKGGRVARVSRFTVRPGATTVDPSTEVVLVGRNSTFANIGLPNSEPQLGEPHSCVNSNGTPTQDCLPADSPSHTIGELEFGPDGLLYVASGDGGAFGRIEPENLRSLDIDSLAGKILRIDPVTGRGVPSNPFYNGSLFANRSKVFAYGLRNPYRFAVSGTAARPRVYIGDVGFATWEEINIAEGGENFGWPAYEGGRGTSLRTSGYDTLRETQAYYATNPDVSPPGYSRLHSDGARAIVAGDFHRGRFIFTDIGDRILQSATVRADGSLTDIQAVSSQLGFVVELEVGPDGDLYYVDFTGSIGRLK